MPRPSFLSVLGRLSAAALVALLLLLLAVAGPVAVMAGQAPYPARDDAPVGANDRVYLADQVSNSISVIDPSTGKLEGLIRLGGPLPGSLRATYKGELLVHGLGYHPDGSVLAAVCVGSNAIVFIDTAKNAPIKTVYVGRAPHEATFSPDGKEVWVTIRGQGYVQILDGKTFEPVAQVQTPDGPGMVAFSGDGKYAYVCSSFSPATVVVDTATRQVVATVKQGSSFCPNIAVAPDGSQVWITLKDIGKTQVFRATPPFDVLATFATGPITNHVNFLRNATGQFAFVTVGGLGAVKVFDTTPSASDGTLQPTLLNTIPVGDLPHGLWPSGDGSRMYVGLENGNGLVAIDAATGALVQEVDVGGQAPQAMVYVPNAVAAGGSSNSNNNNKQSAASAPNVTGLVQPEENDRAYHFRLADGGGHGKNVSTATVHRQQGAFVDVLTAAFTQLEPGKGYVLAMAAIDNAKNVETYEPVAAFKAGPDGSAMVLTVGSFQRPLLGDKKRGRSATSKLVVAPDVGDGKLGSAMQAQVSSVEGYF